MNKDTIKKLPTLPVDSPKILELRSLCQKPRQFEEIWSWYVLRRYSIYITALLRKTFVTPNLISWFSLLFFILTGWLMLLGGPWGFLAAVVAYNLGYLCDCLDGELARLKKVTSSQGIFLDTLIRAMSIPIFASFAMVLVPVSGWGYLSLEAATGIYIITLIATLALLVPLSFNYIKLKVDENDPVSEMRTASSKMEWIAFLTGMPGFFAFLPVAVILDVWTQQAVTSVLIVGFLFVLTLKTLLRLYLTISKLN
ncbi:CDP-alcohol phosphatidyltransferase family protein [Kroppenstedtia pulmonis]|uniref:CDP-alcohol phosphatidyltransferase family protein n=1 Tax=Kroppenstedtia pulmonis TaxID=1380685 RepID=A0A7D4BGE2_9BACL|nr:CDP-alcohol phosphatidyltransferase family protein [Kroppenstedtia pulmonis]QKG83475.1 CDP-alcohol phosphatidyltransferase family protein [Kroppenstedtia pulmonis]